jgi:hypothetical protein
MRWARRASGSVWEAYIASAAIRSERYSRRRGFN